MADSKYADLPGIAYDEPDVCETIDLPESEQAGDFYEDENEAIERIHITASEAFSKFKGKFLKANKVDFSEEISKNVRTGCDARSGDWELFGEGEKETPLQEYQRLQCEMKELLEEVNNIKCEKGEKVDCLVSGEQVEQSLKKLGDLKLEETLGTDVISSISNPQGTQLNFLDSSQLDHIEGRLSALKQKLDAITEKKKEIAQDQEKDKMILELYELVKNSENFNKLLPTTIERLKALELLHIKAMEDKKIVKCRTCTGDHWTSECPWKDTMVGAAKTAKDKKGPTPGAPGGEASKPGGTKYIPPGKRMETSSKARIRIDNLSDFTTRSDLEGLVKPFGPIQKLYLANDKQTGTCKGFAYIHFKFRNDAARAIATLNGYCYDHLILNVDWSKPPTHSNQ